MKVNYKNMIGGYTGRGDDVIYVFDRQTGRYYIRNYPQWTPQPFNDNFALIMKNLRNLKPSLPYKQDLSMYVDSYNALAVNKYNPVKSWNNIFMKVMFSMAKTLPGIDLKTITRQDIYDNNLPCISVKFAVDTGLLPVVRGYQRFDNTI